ncbi:MAG TPA: efflux RND transporter periplasmic adaptor subunit [Prolixibacteraceae bacterium]|nr:efflux RND transporter periplasmic adaptor subunit [Prolixibacteraceae bacterium]HPS11890.1 efflux RND transporter periplasmic adaptor subunit [Prolixibacteraceae bacterium]
MKTTKYILPLLAAIVVFTSCQKKETTTTTTQEAVLVSTTRATTGTYQTALNYEGNVVASQSANLGASLPGKVEKINFKEGDFVKQGAVVAELSGELLTQAEIENDAIRKDYERVGRLLDKQSVTQMDYDHIKAKLEASDAKVAQLKKATMVIAPFSGYITEKLMEEGEMFFINIPLDPGYSHATGIVRLMKLNPINVEVEVNESDLPKLKKGIPVEVTSDVYPDKVFTGKISNIKMMLSTTTHTATLTFEIPNNELLLKPGMFVKASVPEESASGVKVPINAIYRQSGTADDYVFVVKPDMTVDKIKTERLETVGDTVVVNNLAGNETIVTNGRNKLMNGSKVRVN